MLTRFRRPIRQRIALALHLIILTLSGLFATGMLLLVFWFEHTLFYNHLHSDLARNINATSAAEAPLKHAQGDIQFYKLNLHDDGLLPEALRGFPEGDHEVVVGPDAFHLMVRHRPPWSYVLIQDQSEFERYEILLYSGVIVAVLLVWGIGYRLSKRIADQILRPVTQLARAVTDPPQAASMPARRSRHPGPGGRSVRAADLPAAAARTAVHRQRQPRAAYPDDGDPGGLRPAP